MTIRSICVFCGSRAGTQPSHRTLTADLAARLAQAGVEVIYGGGRLGLMGVTADAALAAGGRVVGIIPHFLNQREVEHTGVTELVAVDGMMQRKVQMIERADAFVILPGGLGTLDEALEVITWKQLRIIEKPILILNAQGYWQPFLTLLEKVVDHGFANPSIHDLYEVVTGVDEAMAVLGL